VSTGSTCCVRASVSSPAGMPMAPAATMIPVPGGSSGTPVVDPKRPVLVRIKVAPRRSVTATVPARQASESSPRRLTKAGKERLPASRITGTMIEWPAAVSTSTATPRLVVASSTRTKSFSAASILRRTEGTVPWAARAIAVARTAAMGTLNPSARSRPRHCISADTSKVRMVDAVGMARLASMFRAIAADRPRRGRRTSALGVLLPSEAGPDELESGVVTL
jgi:hypothetical protein